MGTPLCATNGISGFERRADALTLVQAVQGDDSAMVTVLAVGDQAQTLITVLALPTTFAHRHEARQDRGIV